MLREEREKRAADVVLQRAGELKLVVIRPDSSKMSTSSSVGSNHDAYES